ncbi:family 10 glycosylhydrolase [Rivularia sp. UHCC 0363]|uniref:family 10 glycosylhydrolase n=1 Tax=Rivularia sp. UHCC 0363 TaxID=3110244 RepID=UPI002B1E96B6|nr:family 10 glycosylhydrolase [Rivularia sp. UHCC 0363]MEA5597068.1 family 10 glycosylhydrolase [Rivularia sp. UHCC 0363]
MSKRALNVAKPKLILQHLLAVIFSTSLLVPFLKSQPASAQVTRYCHISSTAAREKEQLRLSTQKGDRDAEMRYQRLVKEHSQAVQDCRRRTWPQVQAIWLRLYPCDVQAGSLQKIMDNVVNQGYNQVYVETFFDGQVLLPASTNNTAWPSVIRTKGKENTDLLAQAIQKGRERGLKVYAWMFTTNFGYTYAQRKDREEAIARNGKGQTSLYVVDNGSQVFVDPYNLQAKRDFYQMVTEVMRRRPDGVLFDYVRYPRQAGTDSIATRVTDLWLYSKSTQEALFQRALNNKGLQMIRLFLSKGYVTSTDIAKLDQKYPQEGEPLWQGRTPPIQQKAITSPQEQQPLLQSELWQLSVAHAMQGIVDFLALAAYPAQQQGVPAGAVFFPGGNQTVGRGYDSRLQPWDRFPSSLEWHPMSYGKCGTTNCIVSQVKQVINTAKPGTQIIPALAGAWGKSMSGRPPLEEQMQDLSQYKSSLKGVSHFAYSWQHPQDDNDRKFCRVR